MIPKERGHSKLEELFKHPLYNLPRPALQEDDWLLRLKTDAEAEETEKEGKSKEDSITSDSDWYVNQADIQKKTLLFTNDRLRFIHVGLFYTIN